MSIISVQSNVSAYLVCARLGEEVQQFVVVQLQHVDLDLEVKLLPDGEKNRTSCYKVPPINIYVFKMGRFNTVNVDIFAQVNFAH